MPTTTTQAVSPGYIYTVTASSETIVRDVETNKLLCKANNGKQGMFIAIGGTASMVTDDPTATITQSSTTSGGARFEVQQTRPATGEEGVIYLIPITSGTDADNEYEEWIWVKGEWERLGTTGVNLSNYATLTGANTYSGNNTFNGLLIKANSGSLGDNSVLNRFEADARYGRLAAANTWYGDQTIDAGRTLTLHPTATIAVNNIRGNAIGDGRLNFNSLHLTNITTINADGINGTDISGTNIHTNKLHVGTIVSSNGSSINVNSGLNIGNADISGVRTLQAQDILAGSVLYAPTIASPDTLYHKINLSEVWELQFKNISGGATLSGVQALAYNGRTIDLNYNNWDTIAINSDKLLFPTPGAYLGLNQGIISSVRELSYNGNTAINLAYGPNTIAISNHLTFPNQGSVIELKHGVISGVAVLRDDGISLVLESSRAKLDRDLWLIHSSSLFTSYISEVKSLRNDTVNIKYNDQSFTNGANAVFVAAPEGIKVTASTSNLYNIPEVTIAPSKLEAFQLNASSFGQDKYGLRITPDSCQLYGIDFAYGDVWSTYPMYGDAAPTSLASNIVKIMKPALTLDTTGVASLAFGNAPKVLFRTFPNGGETAIFEFQSGSWSDDSHSAIVTGMVDLRKPNITPAENLHNYSLINKSELLELVPLEADERNNSLAIGYATTAEGNGIAIGHCCTATSGMINLSAGGNIYGARCSMFLYGGKNYADRDNSGYLSFEIGNTLYNDRSGSDAQNDTIVISKPNLWSALDRAKYRGAQPYNYYIASAIASIPALEPNSITHIGAYSSGAAIDLSGITLAQYDDTITTAELWIEVAPAGTTITWPAGMLWPDEADPTVAPSFPGPEASTEAGYIMQRLYCVTLRTQRRRNLVDSTLSSVLIASIAYAVDSKLLNAGAGGSSD